VILIDANVLIYAIDQGDETGVDVDLGILDRRRRVEGDVAFRVAIPEKHEIDPDRRVCVGSWLKRLRVYAAPRHHDRSRDERSPHPACEWGET
jgi:hypothetical protein